jgi:hypothetical protein
LCNVRIAADAVRGRKTRASSREGSREGEAELFTSKRLHRLVDGPDAGKGLKEVPNRVADLCVGIEDHVAGVGVHEASRQLTAVLAAADFVDNAAA